MRMVQLVNDPDMRCVPDGAGVWWCERLTMPPMQAYAGIGLAIALILACLMCWWVVMRHDRHVRNLPGPESR